MALNLTELLIKMLILLVGRDKDGPNILCALFLFALWFGWPPTIDQFQPHMLLVWRIV